MSTETTLDVVGMTCGHCVAAVTAELSGIAGVRNVVVDLESGRVELTSDGPVDPTLIAAAVDEAGYELAP